MTTKSIPIESEMTTNQVPDKSPDRSWFEEVNEPKFKAHQTEKAICEDFAFISKDSSIFDVRYKIELLHRRFGVNGWMYVAKKAGEVSYAKKLPVGDMSISLFTTIVDLEEVAFDRLESEINYYHNIINVVNHCIEDISKTISLADGNMERL